MPCRLDRAVHALRCALFQRTPRSIPRTKGSCFSGSIHVGRVAFFSHINVQRSWWKRQEQEMSMEAKAPNSTAEEPQEEGTAQDEEQLDRESHLSPAERQYASTSPD